VADRLGAQAEGSQGLYLAIATATLIGILINFSPINPIKALYWSAAPRPMKIRTIA
jgi:hypothetical protein